MQCAGGTDWNGCRKPDTCIPVDEKAPCPAKCPLACNAGDLECPGTWKDENGCEQGEYCQPNDMTAICQYSCKAQCPEGEWVCPGKDNDQGCHVEGPCSARVNAQNKTDEPLVQFRFSIAFVSIKKEEIG